MKNLLEESRHALEHALEYCSCHADHRYINDVIHRLDDADREGPIAYDGDRGYLCDPDVDWLLDKHDSLEDRGDKKKAMLIADRLLYLQAMAPLSREEYLILQKRAQEGAKLMDEMAWEEFEKLKIVESAARELLQADHHDHFECRLSDSEMAAVNRLVELLGRDGNKGL